MIVLNVKLQLIRCFHMACNNLELFDDLTVAINEAVKELEIYKRERLESGLK